MGRMRQSQTSESGSKRQVRAGIAKGHGRGEGQSTVQHSGGCYVLSSGHVPKALCDLRTTGEIHGQVVWVLRQSPCLESPIEDLEVCLNDRGPAQNTIVRGWGRHSGVALTHMLAVRTHTRERVHKGGMQTPVGVGVNSLSEPRTQTPCRKARCMCDTWLMRLAVS